MQQKNKLFIGNLAFSATEQELEEAFGAFGEIQEAKIILDRETGRSRGFAFVTFATDADANEALALDGQNLSGRDMRVSVATERPRRQGGGNREGGRRF